MLQPSDDPDLAQKALGPEQDAELGAEDFDGDRAVMAEKASPTDIRPP